MTEAQSRHRSGVRDTSQARSRSAVQAKWSAGTPIDRRAALSALLGLGWGTHALAQAPGPGSPPASPPGQAGQSSATATPDWPKVGKAGAATISIYLPQVDSWDGHRLEVHAAVSIATSESAAPVFGVMEATWHTQVDKGTRTVTLDSLRIVRVRFPSATDKEATYQKLLDQYIPKRSPHARAGPAGGGAGDDRGAGQAREEAPPE